MKYHVARDGQPIGIFLEYEVRDELKSGELRGSDLYWREGMAEWLPLTSAPDLADAFSSEASPKAKMLSPSEDASSEPLVLATLLQRASAKLMDAAIGGACFLVARSGEMLTDAAGQPTLQGELLMTLGGVAALIVLIYNIVMLWFRGQTIGKQWMNIRIANYADGKNPGFVKTVLLREIFNSLIIIGIPYNFGLIYVMADVGFIFRPDRRCIHDHLAGTQVVQGSLPKR